MSARGWDNDAYLLEQLSEEDRAAYEAEYEPLLEAKKVECAEEHERVIDAGGLYILGTERHESRRIGTTSSVAVRAARATPAPPASTSRSTTTSCASSPPG